MNSRGTVSFWLRAMWDGMLLRCPNCRQGRMYETLTRMNERCPNCGVLFEREEGDFIGAVVVAYSLVAVAVAIGVFVLDLFGVSATVQIAVWSVFTVVVLVGCYRNMKGIWIGILHAMVGLSDDV